MQVYCIDLVPNKLAKSLFNFNNLFVINFFICATILLLNNKFTVSFSVLKSFMSLALLHWLKPSVICWILSSFMASSLTHGSFRRMMMHFWTYEDFPSEVLYLIYSLIYRQTTCFVLFCSFDTFDTLFRAESLVIFVNVPMYLKIICVWKLFDTLLSTYQLSKILDGEVQIFYILTEFLSFSSVSKSRMLSLLWLWICVLLLIFVSKFAV